jgi:hypothetical protein
VIDVPHAVATKASRSARKEFRRFLMIDSYKGAVLRSRWIVVFRWGKSTILKPELSRALHCA